MTTTSGLLLWAPGEQPAQRSAFPLSAPRPAQDTHICPLLVSALFSWHADLLSSSLCPVHFLSPPAFLAGDPTVSPVLLLLLHLSFFNKSHQPLSSHQDRAFSSSFIFQRLLRRAAPHCSQPLVIPRLLCSSGVHCRGASHPVTAPVCLLTRAPHASRLTSWGEFVLSASAELASCLCYCLMHAVIRSPASSVLPELERRVRLALDSQCLPHTVRAAYGRLILNDPSFVRLKNVGS